MSSMFEAEENKLLEIEKLRESARQIQLDNLELEE